MIQQQLPTDSELEILQILWENGPSTVRFINDTINQKREVGYTSTLKTMQLMLDKEILNRDIVERIHYYIPNISEHATQKNLLSEFVDAAFRGSESSLVMRMLGDGKSSQEELSKIKAFISSLENNNSNK